MPFCRRTDGDSAAGAEETKKNASAAATVGGMSFFMEVCCDHNLTGLMLPLYHHPVLFASFLLLFFRPTLAPHVTRWVTFRRRAGQRDTGISTRKATVARPSHDTHWVTCWRPGTAGVSKMQSVPPHHATGGVRDVLR